MIVENLDITLLGFYMDKTTAELIRRTDALPQEAANLFAGSVIGCIEENLGHEIRVLSFVPASDFPRNTRPYFHGGEMPGRSQGRYLGFVNLPVIKHLTRTISAISALMKAYRGRPPCNRCLIVYSLHSPLLAAGLVCKRLFGVRMIVIITDLPQFMDNAGRMPLYKKILKWIDGGLIRRMILGADGAITITAWMGKEYLKEKIPYIVVETIKDEKDSGALERASGSGGLIGMYSGSLNAANGVVNMVKAFMACEHRAGTSLWITGRGDIEDWIKEQAKACSDIVYHGHVSRQELERLQRQADFMLSVKPPSDGFARYSFPSKISEYMVMGKAVASTYLSGIPDDYFNHMIMIPGGSVDELKAAFSAISEYTREELADIGADGREFLLATRGGGLQAKRILSFIRTICA
jgi:hypothetical protein